MRDTICRAKSEVERLKQKTGRITGSWEFTKVVSDSHMLLDLAFLMFHRCV